MSQRVLVAMSGGVDSSVAAARLVQAGYDVIGVTLHLWDYPDDGSVRGRCCAPEDIFDARRVADRLGIAHYTYDRRELFERYPGETEFVLEMHTRTGLRRLKFGAGYRVQARDAGLRAELDGILGVAASAAA